eukprot:TRINITY_DN38036_c0_g1_i1.p1 TRINITY_DN38036_c0_g1~~TRINITY_DN38036_c0_g1_i1.p1  ORF type:complete len:280 (-),score=55.94 TRINITY_DN38036_c0_g1_i1:132-971(-)
MAMMEHIGFAIFLFHFVFNFVIIPLFLVLGWALSKLGACTSMDVLCFANRLRLLSMPQPRALPLAGEQAPRALAPMGGVGGDGEQVIFIANHTSFGDFVVDNMLVPGSCQISRKAVMAAVPLAVFSVWLNGTIVLFRRDKTKKSGFVSVVKRALSVSPAGRALIYAEGTRNHGDRSKSLPLKRGTACAAYELGVAVQAVIADGKPDLLDERRLSARCCPKITYAVSAPVHPRDYASADDFHEAIVAQWQAAWSVVYSTDDATPSFEHQDERQALLRSEP